ncbi:MAG TPA: hypothetical protein VFT78_00550 [Hanamia sp.]|nr:hypothetical protein [Hanamia sp.]
MKITEYTSISVDKRPKGHITTSTDFMDEVNHKEAIIKSLN